MDMDVVRIIAAIFLPPLGVFLQVGFGKDFWINLLLTIFGFYILGIVHAVWLTLSGLKPLRFLKFYNPNILFTQVPRLSTFAQKCVLIPPVALLGETPRPHWLIFWAFSC
jgi:uncharacterized membrane protein YqaE (UPF0057 family)